MGRMAHDVRAAVDFVAEGKGWSERAIPALQRDQVYLLGYSLGGSVALHAAALDPRIAGVACFAGFTPMRTDTDAKPTGGLRRLWQWHALLPRLGLFHGREQAVPYDYDDLLRMIAPRPCLVVSPRSDRHADTRDVMECLRRARRAWSSRGAGTNLTHLSPDGISRFQDDQHAMFLQWLRPVATDRLPTP